MSQTLYVTGKMYEANTVDISDEELGSLLAAEQSEEDFWDDLEDLYERLMDDSEINGFRVEDGLPCFSVSVDDEEISLADLSLDLTESKGTQGVAPKRSSHILVFEKWSDRGRFRCDLDDDFDGEMLDFSTSAFVLPTGEISYVVEPSYEDQDFDFIESWTEATRTYVVTKDGQVIDLARA
jgi:hypothetical protein